MRRAGTRRPGARSIRPCDERRTHIAAATFGRRTLVAEHATLNGIDFLEVFDLDAIPVPSPRQRTLLVRFLKPVPALDGGDIVIEGGVRVTPVKALLRRSSAAA